MFRRGERKRPVRDAADSVHILADKGVDLLDDWRREGQITVTVTLELPAFLAKLFGEEKVEIPITIKLPKD